MSKFILVTGAGTGIGRSIAETLSNQGYALILCGRNLNRLEETKTNLKNPSNHSTHSCDIRKTGDVQSVLKKHNVESLYGLVALSLIHI